MSHPAPNPLPDLASARSLAGRFPPGFCWGAATAAYQVEGSVRVDGRGESIWDRFSHTPGAVAGGDTGDVACDHYRRWPADLATMRDLGLDAYRFSVAWPRVLPSGRGAVNHPGLDWYDRLVDALLEADIDPWVTLYHWDLPQPLEDAGGWPNRATVDAFAEYAAVVVDRLGDRVGRFITINEPWVVSILGYARGVLAPGRQDWTAALQAAHHLLVAHGHAVDAVRAAAPSAQVGITLNLTPADARGGKPEDEAAAHRFDGHLNRWFLDPLYGRDYPADMQQVYAGHLPEELDGDHQLIARPTDFLGINYYMTMPTVDAPDDAPVRVREDPVTGERTSMGWLCEPQGLSSLLRRVHEEYSPPSLAITENGAAYPDPDSAEAGTLADPKRLAYYQTHLPAAADAIDAGVPLHAYFAWSLLDNFEWAEGYAKRFGIVHVNYETQERTPKHSAVWYAGLIAAHRATRDSPSM